jgi:hypothetical protein
VPDDCPDLTGVVLKQAEIIQAQDTKITHLEVQNADLTALAGQWKAAHDARAMETVSLRLALDAQKSASKAAVWRTRIGGFAVGFGSGALVGAFATRR